MLFHIGVQGSDRRCFFNIMFFTMVEYKNNMLSSIPLFLLVKHVRFEKHVMTIMKHITWMKLTCICQKIDDIHQIRSMDEIQ